MEIEKARRGSSNGNRRGSSETRRRRRHWLVKTYLADQPARVLCDGTEPGSWLVETPPVGVRRWVCAMPACRCYRCGTLLTVDTVTVDRIIPGCRGGTYRRDNIRPACGRCNSETGGALRSAA